MKKSKFLVRLNVQHQGVTEGPAAKHRVRCFPGLNRDFGHAAGRRLPVRRQERTAQRQLSVGCATSLYIRILDAGLLPVPRD